MSELKCPTCSKPILQEWVTCPWCSHDLTQELRHDGGDLDAARVWTTRDELASYLEQKEEATSTRAHDESGVVQIPCGPGDMHANSPKPLPPSVATGASPGGGSHASPATGSPPSLLFQGLALFILMGGVAFTLFCCAGALSGSKTSRSSTTCREDFGEAYRARDWERAARHWRHDKDGTCR